MPSLRIEREHPVENFCEIEREQKREKERKEKERGKREGGSTIREQYKKKVAKRLTMDKRR